MYVITINCAFFVKFRIATYNAWSHIQFCNFNLFSYSNVMLNSRVLFIPFDIIWCFIILMQKISLSLVIMGNNTEFQSTVIWLSENLMLVDARVNFVECNIRVLGGLVSGHLLATDSTDRLGERSGFVCKKDIRLPINAKFRGPYGVMENETTETSTSGCGSLILEMGALSQLTGDPKYESAALRALVEFTWYKHWMYQLGNGLNIQLGLGLVGLLRALR
ncbi:unnamed protein product [Prunus armeniaca]